MEPLLKIENLTVSVCGKKVVKDVNLEINRGEIHALFGLNGSGKTSLIQAILGNPKYKVEKGVIIFKGENILKLPTYERIRLGIGAAFQSPPAIKGVKLIDILKVCARRNIKKIRSYAKELMMEDFLWRDINYGFSGGEIKRSEILQLRAQNPEILLLDEPDSGVDIVNIRIIGEVINKILEKYKRHSERKKSALIITHTGSILYFVHADRGHVMINGRIACSGNPLDILERIKEKGYGECIRCVRES